jgi:hypothetical protein
MDLCAPAPSRCTPLASIDSRLQQGLMRFSEGTRPWQRLPLWAEFLIKCGFAWGDEAPDVRRISIVSMPCDSAGAGLVALGAMRRRLALCDANDSGSHFRRIERLAAQGAGQTVLRHENIRGRFLVRGRDSRGIIWVEREIPSGAGASNQNGPPRIAILPGSAKAWSFDGEPPVEVVEGDEAPYGPFYDALVEGTFAVIGTNLRRSDSGICLAGRTTGETVSRSITAAIRFEIGDRAADLSQLLTIHSWSPATISRITFLNTRTDHLDRRADAPRVVVADGDSAFLKVIDAPEFRYSDVVGVIHRAVERDRLEAIGDKLAALGQWYIQDTGFLERIQPVPAQITALRLRRR